jgi:hypothetical protein
MTVTGTSQSADAHKRSLPWQDELWEFADTVGELGFIITFFENCGRRCRLVAAWRDDGGGTPTIITGINPLTVKEGQSVLADTTTGKTVVETQQLAPGETLLSDRDVIAQELALSIRARLGGQQALMAKAMANIPHIGDCWLLATQKADANGNVLDTEFETLSISELFEDQQQEGKTARSLMRRRLPNQTAKKLCDLDDNGQPIAVAGVDGTTTTFMVVRIWEPDHRWSDMAYSSLKTVRQTLNVIRLCDLALSAMLDARAHLHGLLLWPDDVALGADINVSDAADAVTTDETRSFLDDMIEEATERKQNHGSPRSLFPFIVPMPAARIPESGGGPRLLSWSGTFEATIAELRDASVTRLAQQTDLPVSVVTGDTGNRWSDFVVKQTLFQAHLAPKFEMIVSAISEQLFTAMLAARFRAELSMSEDVALEAASDYCLWYDAQGLIVNPDRTADADQAFDRFAIGQSAYLRAKGFDENDAPDLEELQRSIALKVLMAAPTVGSKLMSLIGLPALDPNNSNYRPDIAEALARYGETTQQVQAGQALEAGASLLPASTATSPPTPPTTVAAVTAPSAASASLGMCVRAAVHTALNQAGTFLLGQAKSKRGHVGEAELLQATAPALRVAALGMDRALALGLSVDALRLDTLDLLGLDARTRAAVEVYTRRLIVEAINTGVIPEVTIPIVSE